MSRFAIPLFTCLLTVCGLSSTTRCDWKPLYDSMMTHFRVQEFDAALSFGLKAHDMAVAENGAVDSSVAIVLHRIAACHWAHMNVKAGIEWSHKAIEIWRALPEDHSYSLAKSLSNLGAMHSELGDYSNAEKILLEALELKRQSLPEGHRSISRTLAKLGNLYRAMGSYADAEKFLLEAVEGYRLAYSDSSGMTIMVMNNLAVVYHLQRRFDEAASLYEKCIEGYTRVRGWNGAIGVIGNLAALRTTQGDLEEAKRMFLQGLSLCGSLETGGAYREAQLLGYLGEVYHSQHSYAKADSCLDASLDLLLDLWEPDNPTVLYHKNELAGLYRDQERFAEADSLYEQVLSSRTVKLGNRHPDVAQTMLGWARLQARTGNLDSSFALAEMAYDINSQNFLEGAQVLSEKNALAYSADMRTAGLFLVSVALTIPNASEQVRQRAREVICTIKGTVSDEIYRRHQQPQYEHPFPNDSVTQIEGDYRLARAALVQHLISPSVASDKERQLATTDSLTDLVQKSEQQLARLSGSFRLLTTSRTIDPNRIIASLPPQSALVEFLKASLASDFDTDSLTDQYIVLVLDSRGDARAISLGPADKIDALVEKYRAHLSAVADRHRYPRKADAREYDSIIAPLYEAIWKPFEPLVSHFPTVFVAPDGALNLVSFSGLKDSDGKYLIEKHSLNYLGAGRDLLRKPVSSSRSSGLLAFGNPDYEATPSQRQAAIAALAYSYEPPAGPSASFLRGLSTECANLADLTVAPLPSSGVEINRVIKTWKTDKKLGAALALYGPAASEDNFKIRSRNARVLHLSTHGYYLRATCDSALGRSESSIDPNFVHANPLIYSGLFLAGANLHGKGAAEAGVEDGILTAEEVAMLDLRGVQTVVLSACETGIGDIRNNEGVYGLRRAFQMAGARTVISALWQVPDVETATFMNELYTHSSDPLPDRLRRLQLAQIERLRAVGFADHPFAWAAFITIGDWR